jgi:hypothetical protein
MFLLDWGIAAAIGGVLVVFIAWRLVTRSFGWGPSDT